MIRCTPENAGFVCTGLDHPEGLNFAPDGALVAGGEAGQIYRIDSKTGTIATLANTGGFVLGVCLDSTGSIYACDCSRNEVLKIDSTGNVSIYSTGTDEHKLINPNYCAFDNDGNLFFTASGEYFHSEGTGKLFVVTPDGKTQCIHPGPLRFANGICIDPESAILYLVQSTAPNVLAFKLDGPRLGSLQPVRIFQLEPDTVPDGLALDVERNLYVAYYAPDQIGVIRPNGRFEVLYRDFMAELLNRPTNIALHKDAIYFSNLGGDHIGKINHRLEPLDVIRP